MAISAAATASTARRRLPTMSAACSDAFESAALLAEGLGSLPSPHCTTAHHEQPLEAEAGTVVTSHTDEEEEYGSPLDDDGDSSEEEGSECSGPSAVVPAAVSFSFLAENHDHGESDASSSSSSEDEESELEEDADADSDLEQDAADSDEEEEDQGPDSQDQYETDDEDSRASHGSDDAMDDEDDSSCCSSTATPLRGGSAGDDHDLFLPWDCSPSVESLKYEEDDADSSDDEEDASRYLGRTYMIGSGRMGRPRMWDGCPSGVSVSSDSYSSSDDSRSSKTSKKKKERPSKAAGVSFSDAVTVYPVYPTEAYPAEMLEDMYTGKEELKANKLRNKREYAYDRHDWRNATEEGDMEPNDDGELVHPVHCTQSAGRSPSPPPPAPAGTGPCRTRNAVRTYSSAIGSYRAGGGALRRKRMRMW